MTGLLNWQGANLRDILIKFASFAAKCGFNKLDKIQ